MNASTLKPTVATRLEDIPAVRDVVLAAASAARDGSHAGAAMTHSWVITGAPGSGRSEVALAFAAALECTDPGVVGCGQCEGCLAVLEGQHTDVTRVVPRELSIGVDFVRDNVISAAHRRPTVGAWRVVIIEDADRLSAQAADALLKTVEEPPASTVIIFLAPSTDPADFSQTLRSRCRHVYVPSPSVAEIVRILTEEEGAGVPQAELAAAASLRHVGRARRLVSTPSMQQRRAQVLNLAALITEGDRAFRATYALVKAIEKEALEEYAEQDAQERATLENSLGMGGRGKGVHKALRGAGGEIRELEKKQKMRGTRRKRDLLDLALVDLTGLYRDAYLKAIGADVELTHPDFSALTDTLASTVGDVGLVRCMDAIGVCRRQITENVQFTIATDGMVGRLRQAYQVD